jgi:hypothetical protein
LHACNNTLGRTFLEHYKEDTDRICLVITEKVYVVEVIHIVVVFAPFFMLLTFPLSFGSDLAFSFVVGQCKRVVGRNLLILATFGT